MYNKRIALKLNRTQMLMQIAVNLQGMFSKLTQSQRRLSMMLHELLSEFEVPAISGRPLDTTGQQFTRRAGGTKIRT